MKKVHFHFPLRSNLFSRSVWVLAALLVGCLNTPDAQAINLSAIYSSACQREIGIVIDADDSKVRILTLEGEVKRINRFNIVYMAYYPVGDLPIPEVKRTGNVELINIKTVYEDEVVDLMTGWMIDAADDRISFLTIDGKETVLDQDDIWDIELIPMHENIKFESSSRKKHAFVHPYPFQYCKGQPGKNAGEYLIYPQHLLEDPIRIKRELDRLKEGYDKLKGFQNDKKYYPKPQVYGNSARLGLWGIYGTRYGGSKQRNNSFIPEIISESSSGPFGFQYVLVTGSALIPSSVHEEPQMNFYYALKADYVHFAIMVDFNRYVIGETNYEWHADDLNEHDHRDNDTFNVSGGFDYGSFTLDLSIWNRIQYGVRSGDYFHENAFNLNKGGITFENRFIKAELQYGFGDDKKKDPIPVPDDANEWEIAYIEAYNAHLAKQPDFETDYLMGRLNLTFFSLSPFNPRYSLIYREIDFRRENNLEGTGAFRYKGSSLTNALYVLYPYDDEISFGGFLSLELLENSYGETGLDDSSSNIFPKGGLNIALIF